MPHLALANVTLDVNDLDRGVRFWTAALGYVCVRRDDYYAKLEHPTDPRRIALGLQPTHEPKRDANRMHVDLDSDELRFALSRS